MAKERHLIYGVHITDRVKSAAEVQQVLTEHGCSIKTRLGLHEVSEASCAPNGLLLLEMAGGPALCEAMADKLNAIEGVEVQQMVFDHPTA